MKLTKTSVQAVLAVVFLAEQSGDRPTQARQVGEHLGVPTDSALKVLQTLVRQNVLRSQLGRSGGYRFHQDPMQIDLLQIVEAIEGPIGAEVPELEALSAASVTPLAVLGQTCARSAEFARNELARVKVSDLMDTAATERGLALAG